LQAKTDVSAAHREDSWFTPHAIGLPAFARQIAALMGKVLPIGPRLQALLLLVHHVGLPRRCGGNYTATGRRVTMARSGDRKTSSSGKEGTERRRPVAAGGSKTASAPQAQEAQRPTAHNGAPTEEEVRQRAYELYLTRGGTHGAALDDWLRAERELRAS
jgi:DUF2934 family protein